MRPTVVHAFVAAGRTVPTADVSQAQLRLEKVLVSSALRVGISGDFAR